MVKFGGLQKTSLVDYPDEICTILFTIGCNFRCPYCHNKELVNPELFPNEIPEDYILGFLKERKKYIDALTITGGEPTIHKDLPEFIKKVKDLGFKVKIDTNGTNPEMIKFLIENKLVDFIAMDYKAPIKKYPEVVRAKIDIKKIEKTKEIIMKSNVNYEFRITVVPTLLTKEDIIQIGEELKGAKQVWIQQFENKHGNVLDDNFLTIKPYRMSEIKEMVESIKNKVQAVDARGIV